MRSLSFNPDHSLLASAGDDHQLVVWKVGQSQPIRVLAERGAPIYSAVFSGDGRRIAAVGFEEAVTIYDVESGKAGTQTDRSLRRFAAAWSSRPTTSGWRWSDATARFAFGRRPTGKSSLEINADQQRVRNLAYSPDGAKLAAAGDGRTIGLWDAHTGELLHRLTAKPAKIMSLAFCGDELLATGGSDNVVRIWDLTKPAERWHLSGHSGSVAALACDPETGVLASGSFDTTVRVWQFDLQGPVAETAAQPALLPELK